MKTGEQAILIVDDRPANLLALEKTLNETCVQIVKAESGERALAATLDHNFSLAILDVQMPIMNGYELAELLRGNPETSAVPIIFLTAASSEEWQIFKGYESGAVDYIVKPYNPTVLLAKVRVFLELHEKQNELERQRQHVAAANKELEAFAYSVSHDLRAPLRHIDGFSQALLEDYEKVLDEQGKDFLQRISKEATRMTQLVDDLLRLSRITQMEMQWQRVDLAALARAVLSRLRERDGRRSVEVQIADELLIRGDPCLLEQALENLLSNAWKFSSMENTAQIEMGETLREGRQTFFIRDNGVGFDMKYSDKLFTPFRRLHSDEEFPGTGVGLSIVQRIVTRHNGRIWYESALGVGTTVYFTLAPSQVEPDCRKPSDGVLS